MQEEIHDGQDEKIFLASKSLSSQYTLRSEMAQEIISRQPGFIEKWALLIFLLILLLIFGGTWFIHYPDIVTTRAILTAETNPKEIIVRQEGRLIKLFVKNNQQVKHKDIIGWIEGSADYSEIIGLSKQLDECVRILNTDKFDGIFYLFNKHLNNLGEIQQAYQQFVTSEEIFKDYNTDSSLPRRHQQKMLFQRELSSLKILVNDWISKHILQAPIDGRISFINSIQQNKYLRNGALLGYVIPNDSKYYAELVLPQNNLGKIDTGLHVQLRFEAYPYEEWGFVNGTLSYISNVPTENGFLATIKLDRGLITNNEKHLVFKTGLRAQAIIITKDMRLLQRFYYGFVKSTSIDK